MSRGKKAILVISVVAAVGALAAVWFGGVFFRGSGSSKTMLVTAYDAKGGQIAGACGFFVGPRHLVFPRHLFRGAERLEVKTPGGRSLAITHILAENTLCNTALVMTDAPADAAQVLKLAAVMPAAGDRLTVLLPRLANGGRNGGKGAPTGEVRVSEVPGEKWDSQDLFIVEGDIPEEATGSAVVNAAGEAAGIGTFLVAEGRPIRYVISSAAIAELVKEADRGKPVKYADWMKKVPKDVTRSGVGQAGRLMYWARRFEDSLACYVEAVKVESSNAERWADLWKAYACVNRHEDAARAAEEALRLDPKNATIRQNLAWSYAELGRSEDAIALYKEQIRIRPTAEAFGNLGSLYLELKRNEEALASFRDAVRLDGKLVKARSDMAVAYLRLGQAQTAADELMKAIEIEPDNALVHCNLGNVYVNVGRYEDALEECRKAIALDPKYAEAHVNAGAALGRLGRKEEAVEELLKAIEIEPDNVLAHRNLGDTYLTLGRYEDAIKECRKAIELDPKHAEAYVDLGNACDKTGNHDEAIANYQKAISLNPDYAIAHNNLASIYGDLKRFEDAVKEAQQAIRCDPQYRNAYNNLGWNLKNLKRNDEAIDAFTKAIEIDPQFTVAYENRGWTYFEAGRIELAIKECETLKKLNSPEAESIMKAIEKRRGDKL